MDTPRSAVAVVFDTRGQAESAIDHLWHYGFAHDQVGIVTPGGKIQEATTATEVAEDRAGNGAVVGAATGATVGALAGALAVGLIPGIGPVLAGGLLTGIALGGTAGAAVGTFFGPFVSLGFSEEEAHGFEHEVKSGKTVVMVKTTERQGEALTILHTHGGHDIAATQQMAMSSRMP